MINKKIAVVLIISLLCFASGCQDANETKTSGTVMPTATKAAESVKERILKEGAADTYTVEEAVFKDTAYSNSDINIRYPQLKSGAKDVSAVNQFIKNTVFDYINTVYGNDYTDMQIDLDYEVTYNQNGLISVYFDGTQYLKGAAYPNNFLFSINYDLEQHKELYLTDLITVNETTVQLALDNGTDYQTKKEYVLEHYSMAQLIEACKDSQKVRDTGLSAYAYFNKDAVFISLSPIPHALGDHVEFSINWSQLSK